MNIKPETPKPIESPTLDTRKPYEPPCVLEDLPMESTSLACTGKSVGLCEPLPLTT